MLKKFIYFMVNDIIITQHKGITVTFLNFVHVYITPTMWLILQYFHLHISTILHWSIKQFLMFMILKMSFNYI
jgi:hypothetical protein